MSSGSSHHPSTHQRHSSAAAPSSSSSAMTSGLSSRTSGNVSSSVDETTSRSNSGTGQGDVRGRGTNRSLPSSVSGIRNASPMSVLLLLVGKTTMVISIILRVLLFPLLKISKWIFPPKEADGITNIRNLDRAARLFSNHFQSLLQQHSSTSTGEVITYNPFENTCYQKCVTQAERTKKALLLYVHSPMHPKSSFFLKKFFVEHAPTLQFLQESQQHLLVCGVSKHTAEGEFLATQQFGATEFPFLALVGCRSNSSSSSSSRTLTMELLLRMEGTPSSPDEFHRNLVFALNRHVNSIAQAEARRLQREEEARLRQEQDREYQEALRLDREREEQCRREEEERRAEEERQQQAARAKEEAKQKRIEHAQSLLSEGEPEATLPRSELSNVRITLPSGQRLQRRFRADDTIAHIRAYLVLYFNDLGEQQTSSKPAHVIEHFSFSTNYPRRTFQDTASDNDLVLRDAGLVPQGVLMVQDLDA